MDIGQHVEVNNPGSVLHGERATVTAHSESGEHEKVLLSGKQVVWIEWDGADDPTVAYDKRMIMWPAWFYVVNLEIVVGNKKGR